MNAYRVLEPSLKVIIDGINPIREDWEMRFKIIGELQDVVTSVESLTGATVEPFGSFVSNLFTRWGDLDISILLPNGSYISSAGKKRKQNLLGDLLIALRKKGGWHRLQFIPNARVPILKFERGDQRISCDISIDNLQGIMKSKFLFWFNEIDKRFRDMVLLVKEWAKTHNINNPKAGSFNSYSLSLLVIFHFQTCVPPIFPPLKDIYPGNVIDDLTGVRTDAEREIGEICAANISRYRSDKYQAVNRSSLSELFISFLAKFLDIDLRAEGQGICPYRGRWEQIRKNTRWLPRTYAIFIEDPFEQPENTARAVSARNLKRISEAFQTTYYSLVSANPNQISLSGTLVRPKVSHLISGTPVTNPSYIAGHHLTALPQMSRAVYTPSQVQRHIHQIQNSRQEDHPNNFSVQRNGSYGSSNKLRQEGHPSNLTKQRQESYPNNSTKQRQGHPNNSTEQRQEGHPSNLTKQRPVLQYHNPSQSRWRPKSHQ